MKFDNFTQAREAYRRMFLDAPPVDTERWQGVKANTRTREILNMNTTINLHGIEDLDHWRRDIRPNLPWADDHFLERVGGEPLNPGEQWKHWPWSNSAGKFIEGQRFNHNYMERLWPKFARRTPDGSLCLGNTLRKYPKDDPRPKYGIGHHYGDLQDLVELLADEPYTRQAYIPLFFPEDTGFGDGGRKVCTLGYQIIVRDNGAHIWYPMRSCDFIRHWSDDCYLAVRLLLWIIDECSKINSIWKKFHPGLFEMHATSFHIFEADIERMTDGRPNQGR